MSELTDLYQQVILDHNRRPRNFRKIERASRTAEGFNPLCGDHLTLYMQMDGDVITDISFEGSGCAISKAAASMMTDAVKGKSKAEAEELFHKVHQMLTGQPGDPFDAEELGKLAVFAGVCEFPARVKCASLAWHTMHTALEGENQIATTE
jgi:nitrogen fixation NifU-like protein